MRKLISVTWLDPQQAKAKVNEGYFAAWRETAAAERAGSAGLSWWHPPHQENFSVP